MRFLYLIIWMVCPAIVNAAYDDVQYRLQQAFETPLRWDNIEGKPEWVSGKPPRFHFFKGLHFVTLQPGENTVLLVPQGAHLRLYHPDHRLSKDDLDIQYSNGSGLFVSLPVAVSQDERSLITHRDVGKPNLIRVSHAAAHQSKLQFALFISRFEPLHSIAPYRNVVSLPTSTVKMRRSDQAASQTYWQLQPEENNISVTVQGPARFALEHRLAYPGTESRLMQTYRIFVDLNDAPYQGMVFDTSAEYSASVYVNWREEVTGQPQTGYINIPEGTHQLRFRTTAKVYARLLQQVSSDYLLPFFNRPDKVDLLGLWQTLKPLEPSFKILNRGRITQQTLDHLKTPAEKEQFAQRLAKDNNQRESGILAAMIMRHSAMAEPYDIRAQSVASQMLGANSFYQNLRPSAKNNIFSQRVNWFIAERLQNPGEQKLVRLAGRQHLNDILNRLNLGYFVDLPVVKTDRPTCENAYCYILPSRKSPGILRVIADLDNSVNSAVFMVQFDDETPVRVQVTTERLLADTRYTENLTATGLNLLVEHLDDIGLPPTLEGVFNRWFMASPLVTSGTFEFDMPENVRQVKIWQPASSGNISIAVQHRVSRFFSFSERAFLASIDQFSGTHDVYHQFLQALKKLDSGLALEEDLANHWLPLLRFLRSQHALYAASVSKPSQLPANQPNDLPRHEIDRLRTLAELAENNRQWIVALEKWKKILHGGKSEQTLQQRAELAIVNALGQLGEHFLMEQQLRGLLFYTQDPALRDIVFEKLKTYYRQINDIDKLQLLLGTMLQIDPKPEYSAELVDVLLENDLPDMALMVGLTVPKNQRSLETMIQAAYQSGWWAVFQALVDLLPEHSKQHFWWAQYALEQGDYTSALQHFTAAGEVNNKWHQSLSDGIRIRRNLADRNKDAIRDWIDWQSDHPGPYRWREEQNIITDYSGAVLLYNSTRDLSSQAYLATTDKPVKLSFIGPLTLRVDARPVHSLEDVPIDTWLELRSRDGLRLLPVNNNRQTDWPTIVSHEGWTLGQRVTEEFNFGPGYHEVTLSGNEFSFLINVFVQRPFLDLGILPPANHPALIDWLSTAFDLADPVGFITDRSPGVNPQAAGGWPEAALLAEGDIEAAIALYSGQLKADSKRLMTLLLWLAEQNLQKQEYALVLSEALIARFPDVPELRVMLTRLANRAGWLPIENIQQSAGKRFIETTGWEPETPSLRVRRALLAPLQPDEYVVTGTNRLILKMNNLSSTILTVTLFQDNVRYVKPVPLTVFYQIDAQAPIYIELTPEEPLAEIEIPVSSGMHTLKLGALNPVTNQLVRIRFAEPGANLQLGVNERAYHVATHQEPVVLNVDGPAWLRIDRLKDGETVTTYRQIGDGFEEIVVRPEAEEQETLVRVFRRYATLRQTEIQSRRTNVPVEPVPEAMVSVHLNDNPGQVLLHDGYPLGSQEDGTWSISNTAVSRRNFGDSQGANDSERFFESSVTHRYFNANRRLYSRTDLLGRAREHGEPSFGISESLLYQPLATPFHFRLNGSLHMQQFNRPDNNSLEWAALFDASVYQRREISPKTWYLPELSFFHRVMSLSPSTVDDDRLDQDVYTKYKADHQRGVRISNLLAHRPWLDTLWQARFSVVSNENGNVFQPDHLWFSANWRQLIGKLDMDIGYRLIHFFSDGNRANSFDRHSFVLNMAWNQWRINQQRIEIGFTFRRDFDISNYNALVYLSWNFGRGRMYRDFQPGEIGFMDLRRQHIPHTINNQMQVP